jgi:dGTPase
MANSRAARVVSELLLLVAVFPELVDPPFRASHERLWGGEYLRYYRTLAGGSVNIPAKFLHFLPLDRLIGIQRQSRGDGHVVNIEDLVVAKDFVASLTDRRAHELYATFLGK